MRKNNLVLLSCALLLASCNNTVKESGSEESVASLSASEQVSAFDESPYTLHQFFNVGETLYIRPGEVYYLSKMAISNAPVTFTTNHPSLAVSEDGVLTGLEIDDVIVSDTLYIHDETRLQKITVHVVDNNEYGNYFARLDMGRLYNKNVVFFGDSITHNWVKYPGGNKPVTPAEIQQSQIDSLGYPDHYIPRLNTLCKFKSVTNAAWSGGTMAWLPQSGERFTYKSFIGSIQENEEAVKKADVMIVFYGTNDLSDQVPIGKMTDMADIDANKNQSFVGSMKYGIEYIKKLNPNANLVFFNVLTRTYPYSGEYKLDDYNKAINDVCRAYMINMLDVNSLFKVDRFTGIYSNDGLHLNGEGYSILVDYILGLKNENN